LTSVKYREAVPLKIGKLARDVSFGFFDGRGIFFRMVSINHPRLFGFYDNLIPLEK
jgi:hypothetical protein